MVSMVRAASLQQAAGTANSPAGEASHRAVWLFLLRRLGFVDLLSPPSEAPGDAATTPSDQSLEPRLARNLGRLPSTGQTPGTDTVTPPDRRKSSIGSDSSELWVAVLQCCSGRI